MPILVSAFFTSHTDLCLLDYTILDGIIHASYQTARLPRFGRICQKIWLPELPNINYTASLHVPQFLPESWFVFQYKLSRFLFEIELYTIGRYIKGKESTEKLCQNQYNPIETSEITIPNTEKSGYWHFDYRLSILSG